MATVILVSPHDGGTYQTDGTGALVPFMQTGVVDVPGQAVQLYEHNTDALLGTTTADTDPLLSGDYAGWYYWEIPVFSWTGAGGAIAPSASVDALAGGVSLSGALGAPAGTGTTEGAGVSLASTTILPAYSATAYTAAADVGRSGALPAPAGTGTSSGGGVSISSGGAVSVSDDFNRANNSTLGSNWTVIDGFTSCEVNGNSARGPGGASRGGNYWSANTFASNHSSRVYMNTDTTIAVRIQANGARYEAEFESYDDGEGGGWDRYKIMEVDSAEGRAVLQYTEWGFGASPLAGELYWRLEAAGTSLTLKGATTSGGTYTTRVTATDATLSGGAPGFTAVGAADDWAGADL